MVCQLVGNYYNHAVPKVMRWLSWAFLCAGTLVQTAAEPAFSSKNSSWGARVWRSEDGLPENNVTGAVQTPEGYLWVATHAGLARFDGVQFRRFPLRSDAGVHRRMIRASLLDHEKSVWLALEGGMVVSLSSTATNVFTPAQGLAYGWPWVLTQDGDGAVWIGYADGTAFRIANGQVTRFDEAGRTDLSVEATVLKPEYRALFTTAEISEAKRRLDNLPDYVRRRPVPPESNFPDELGDDAEFTEGGRRKVLVNAHERNLAARAACIAKYGTLCTVCGINFEERYGAIGKGFIHVHHKKPLAARRGEYKLDPKKDLAPVCPNCHAMLHTQEPPLGIDELISILAQQQNDRPF